jgi:hypothetical protein
MRREFLTGLLALSAALLVPAAVPAERPNAAELKKLHIVMVFDTRASDLAKSVRLDEWRMRLLWKETIPSGRYTLTTLSGANVTKAGILAHYKNLRLGPNDGVLFYYAGHAATDPTTGKHYFDLAGDNPLFRKDLVKAMEATRAGLTVLLTDCCSTPRKPKAKEGFDDLSENLALGRGEATRLHPTVRQLLFLARGTVDVTAATDNASWSDIARGGLFTRSLYLMFKTPLRELDSSGNVNWRKFFPKLQRQTQDLYRLWRTEMIARGETDINERTQKPHAFNLGQGQPTAPRHAVISIENGSNKSIRYRCRWGESNRWYEVQLNPGQKRLHVLDVTGSGPLPRLETRIVGVRTPKVLTPGEWHGEGEPDADAAKLYRVRSAQE